MRQARAAEFPKDDHIAAPLPHDINAAPRWARGRQRGCAPVPLLDHTGIDTWVKGKGCTIAASAVLICFNWPQNSDRNRRIANFVERFFPKLAELQKPPRHPKWRETNLTALLPGWNRFLAAVEWLKQHEQARPLLAGMRQQSDQFVAQRGGDTASQVEHDRLFQEFLEWQAHAGGSIHHQ